MSEREKADLRGNDIAMIFQELMTSLNPAFTVGYQIAEGIMRHRNMSKAEVRAETLDALAARGHLLEIAPEFTIGR